VAHAVKDRLPAEFSSRLRMGDLAREAGVHRFTWREPFASLRGGRR